jgi:serine/threonine-protein kinase
VLGLSLYLFIMKSVWWAPLYPCLAVAFPFATTVFFKLRSAEKGKKVEEARVREAQSQAAEAVLEKGLAFQEKGSLELASATFAKLPMNEEMKTIYLNLGFDFQNRGKLDQALHCYQRVYETDPGFADVASRIEALQAAGVGTQFVAPTSEEREELETSLSARPPATGPRRSQLRPISKAVPTHPAESTADDPEAATVLTGGSKAMSVPSRPRTSADHQSEPGTPGSRYRMIRSLGKGGMGEVTLMEDSKLDRKVAVKMMRPDVKRSSREAIELRHRFVREAKTAGKLSHPNIVTIYDSFEGEDGVAYIVMEYVEGRTLTSFINAEPLSVPQIKHIIISALEGLQYAHENGVFHRDIKPDNIMISQKTGVVKVMDFGIARVVESEMTATGSILGTPSYMSPEQMSGEKIDGRSDLFSLGVVLFELLTGTRPFTGSLSEIMMAVLQNHPPPPSTVDPARGVSPGWDPIVLKALAKEVEQRYQTANEFAQAVRRSRA